MRRIRRGVHVFWKPPWPERKSELTAWPPGIHFARIRKAQAICLSLRWLESPRDVAGAAHHFRFVQLPFNLAMPEALTRPNQMIDGKPVPMVQAARNARNLADYKRGAPARSTHEELTRVRVFGARIERKFHSRFAIRAFRSGTYHRAGGYEPDGPRG